MVVESDDEEMSMDEKASLIRFLKDEVSETENGSSFGV